MRRRRVPGRIPASRNRQIHAERGLADARIRYWAVGTLGNIGPPAEAATEVLLAALRDSAALVRHSALVALPEVDVQVAVEAITQFLSFAESDTLGRVIAIQILESLGRDAKSAVPVLEELIQSKGQVQQVKDFAAWAVQTLREVEET